MTAEEKFWALASKAGEYGIPRSRLGQLAKLCNDYAKSLSILTSSLATKKPSTYLGKCLANMREDQAAPQVPIPRTHEPSIVLEARLRGWPVRKSVRSDGSPGWWICGILYDRQGVDVGG